jgi:hypothetical protein
MAATLDKVIAIAPDRISVYNYAHMPQLSKAQKLIRDEDLPDAATKFEPARPPASLQMTKVIFCGCGVAIFLSQSASLIQICLTGAEETSWVGFLV